MALADQIQGMRAAKAAFQALPQVTRLRLNAATEATVREIVRRAQAQLLASPSVQTYSLWRAVDWMMNKNNGRGKAGVASVTTTLAIGDRNVKVRGIVTAGKGGSASTKSGAKQINPRRYAHLVEFGTRYFRAEPFMLPAAEAETQPYLRRCLAEGPQIEHDLSKIGSRML